MPKMVILRILEKVKFTKLHQNENIDNFEKYSTLEKWSIFWFEFQIDILIKIPKILSKYGKLRDILCLRQKGVSKRKHWLCVCLFYLLCIYLWLLLGRHGSCVQKRIHKKNIEEAKILSSSFLKIIVLNLANHIMSISVKRFLTYWLNLKLN